MEWIRRFWGTIKTRSGLTLISLLIIWALVEDRLVNWANSRIDEAMASDSTWVVLLYAVQNMHIVIWGMVPIAVLWILYDAYRQTTLGVYPDFAKNHHERELTRRAEQNRERLRESNKEPALNYEPYDLTTTFRLWQAALLWVGKDPAYYDSSDSDAYPYLNMLIDAINNKELKPYLEPELAMLRRSGKWKAHDNAKVKRDSLREYALAKNLRPPFLFPEDRN